jgi:archaellum component FlaC
MEADEVYSELSGKISELGDKLSEFQGTIDSLQSSISEQKGALEKIQADIEQIKSALNDIKSGASSKQDTSQQAQGLDDLRKKIEEANAAAEKKWNDQQGLIGKLAAQADDAAKTLINFPDTAKAIANKAWEDGKKEILNTWESSKNDIMNSLSTVTTGLIKEAKTGIKDEIKDELKSLILDDVKDVETEAKSSQPAPLSDEELEAKIKTIVKQVAADK